MIEIEKTDFKGWPNSYRISNGEVEAIVPGDIGPPGPRHAHAEQRQVSAVLTRPLGPRVLLDGRGSPVLVLG